MNARLRGSIERFGQQEVVIPTEYGIVVDSEYLQLTREHSDQ